MAFRTNQVPAIEERTVSGSSVSFNSAFALPLKACKVSFSATQAGSGDPTPLNIRNINYIDEIMITHNSTPIIIDLNGHRAIGTLNIVDKTLTVTHDILIFDGSDDEVWVTNSNNGVSYNIDSGSNTYYNVISCNEFIPTPAKTGSSLNNYEIALNLSKVNLLVKYDNAMTAELFKSYLSSNNLQVVLRRETPQTIILSDIPILSTVIGNNTFASDSGSIDLTYKDLDIAKRGNFREVFRLPS